MTGVQTCALPICQSKQLDLLKNIGFASPSWEDLSYVLIGIIVTVSLLGAAWTLYSRSQHDPWLRLLWAARKRLQAAGLPSDDATPPRELARRVVAQKAHWGSAAQALHDWLHQLELQRYAPPGARSTTLAALRTQFSKLPALPAMPVVPSPATPPHRS